jgi:hypothetical protein
MGQERTSGVRAFTVLPIGAGAVESVIISAVVAALESSETPASARAERLRDRLARTGWDRFDVAIVVVAAIATFAVHPIQGILSHPYWFDEAWVAALSRVPLSRLLSLHSPVPTGFITLLGLVPGSGLQRARLVVLLFAALTTVMAYVVTRSIGWPSRATARVAAVAAAAAVMLVPAALIRNDLKQYTCDAFCALLVLSVGAWADRGPESARLRWLAAVVVIVLPFSSTSAFVTVSAFTGLLASAAIDRRWPRVREILIVGAVAAVVVGAYYAAVVIPSANARLEAFWKDFYLSGSPQHMVRIAWDRLVLLQPHLAMPAGVFVAFFVVGIAVLARLGARAIAVAVPVLWVEMAVAGRLRRYPFLDLRTSNFLLMSSLVVVVIGVVGLLAAIASRRPAARSVRRIASVVLGVAVAAAFASGSVHHVRQLAIPNEDVRSPTFFVAAHVGPHDVILVNQAADYGFSFYWPRGGLEFHRNHFGTGFAVEATDAHAIYTPDRTYSAILASLRVALDRWRHAGPDSRLFVVRTHSSPHELKAWKRAFTQLGVEPRKLAKGGDLVFELGPPIGG